MAFSPLPLLPHPSFYLSWSPVGSHFSFLPPFSVLQRIKGIKDWQK